MKRSGLILALIIITSAVFAQQLPSSIKWQQINTPHFKIVFPGGLDSVAQVVANNMEKLYVPDAKNINGLNRRKIPLILNNYTAVSNGYSALMPLRMHWYLMPYRSTALGFDSWTSILAIHEYRHIAQFRAFNQGFNYVYRILGGDLGQGLGIALSAPMWFLEGDAVFNETIFSHTGRGRSGSFAMPVKAIALEYPEKKLNYYKFYYRSYKTYYPNWYYLGYYMVTYLYRHKGEDAWKKPVLRSTYTMILPNSLNFGLWSTYRLSFRKLFDSTFAELKDYWTEKTDSTPIVPITLIQHGKNRSYTGYVFPGEYSGGNIITLKYGFDLAPHITIIDTNGKEHFLRQIPDYYFSYAKNLAAWTDLKPHKRWGDQYFNDIVLYDLNSKKLRYITSNGRYQMPRLSDDATLLTAVFYNQKTQPSIVVFDTKTGKQTGSYPLHKFESVRQPSFSADNQKIVFTAVDASKGLGLYVLDRKTGKLRTILQPSFDFSIEYPVLWGKYVIFASDLNSVNNLYAIDTATHEFYQLTNCILGCSYPKVGNQGTKLLFSTYTADGWQPASITLNPGQWKKLGKPRPAREDYFLSEKTAPMLHIYTDPQTFVTDTFEITKYKHLPGWLKPHSWSLLLEPEGNNYTFNPQDIGTISLNLFFTDILNEVNWTAGAAYDRQGSFSQNINFNLMRYYPVVSLSLQNKFNYVDTSQNLSGAVNIYIPLDFSKDIWYRNMTAGVNTSLTHSKTTDSLQNLVWSTAYFRASNAIYTAPRDVESRIRQSVYASASYIPGQQAKQFTAALSANFPGFLRHDVVKIGASFQIRDNYSVLPYYISMPRGYSATNYTNIKKLSLTYHLPLFYPDWGINRLFFFKRVRAKVFYDIAGIDNLRRSSAGVQLLFDTNFLGYPISVSWGIQAAYLIETKSWDFAPVFLDLPINF